MSDDKPRIEPGAMLILGLLGFTLIVGAYAIVGQWLHPYNPNDPRAIQAAHERVAMREQRARAAARAAYDDAISRGQIMSARSAAEAAYYDVLSNGRVYNDYE